MQLENEDYCLLVCVYYQYTLQPIFPDTTKTAKQMIKFLVILTGEGKSNVEWCIFFYHANFFFVVSVAEDTTGVLG